MIEGDAIQWSSPTGSNPRRDELQCQRDVAVDLDAASPIIILA
jgi:hypothetical protein